MSRGAFAAGGIAGTGLLFLLQNAGLLMGALSATKTQIAPRVEFIDPSQVDLALYGVAVLFVLFAVYRLGKKAGERFG